MSVPDYGRQGEAFIPCAACGVATDSGAARGYRFGAEGILCWACAMTRGGSYDSARDQWITPPHVEDLEREEDYTS